MPFHVSACGLSDVGLVRRKNEDVWAMVPDQTLYLLADGMGGHRSGDVAARETVAALTRLLADKLGDKERPIYEVASEIRLAVEEANRIVYQMGKSSEQLKGMGTTLCCVHVHHEGVIYAHVGDSRIYRLRDGELEQITEDHSLLRELVAAGQIRDENAGDFVYKNIITKALGTEPIVEPSIGVSELQMGDIFLLCSDGLSDLINKDELEVILAAYPAIDDAAAQLITEAKARGGHDNITVVLINIQAVDENAKNLSR